MKTQRPAWLAVGLGQGLQFLAGRVFKAMSSRAAIVVSITCLTLSAPAAPARPPQIAFDSMVLDFGKVPAGRMIEHSFVLTNTGGQTLEIQDVRPTCGCTIAGTWDRKIEPGHAGVIPVRYNSERSEGDVVKTLIVVCNDPMATNIVLQLKGTVWRAVEVQPLAVTFNASADNQTNQTRVAHIINHLDQPLVVSEPVCSSHSFQTALKTVQPGKEFELQVTLLAPFEPGNLTAPITLKTSSSDQPVIVVVAAAVVQSSVAVIPPQIRLAPGVLRSAMETNVIIQNNRPGTLAVSQPVADIPGLTLSLRELQPGRQFVLTTSFPAGFQLPPGKSIHVRMKTSDPRFPTLTVPVVQDQHLASMLNTSESD